MLEAPIAFTLPACDSSADISDLWQERTDPENVHGQTAEAHFAHHARPELVGLTITGGDAPRFWTVALPRSLAMAALGADVVADLEADLETYLSEPLEDAE